MLQRLETSTAAFRLGEVGVTARLTGGSGSSCAQFENVGADPVKRRLSGSSLLVHPSAEVGAVGGDEGGQVEEVSAGRGEDAKWICDAGRGHRSLLNYLFSQLRGTHLPSSRPTFRGARRSGKNHLI